MRTREIISALRYGGPFHVASYAGGWIRVYPGWASCLSDDPSCSISTSDENGVNYCSRCECNHMGGFTGRMEVATAIEELLNKLASGAVTLGRGKTPE